MELSDRITELEKRQARDSNWAEMSYNMLYGITVKLDMLQAIVLEVIDSLEPDVKSKITSDKKLESIADAAKASVQKRLDAFAFGERPESAPLEQLIADRGDIDAV